MKYLVPILILLLLLALLVLFVKHRQRPQVSWASRVLRRRDELRSRLDQILHPRGNERSAAERLADELFAKQKNNVSVQALSRYNGVGPKTVEWLQNANIRTLTDAEGHASAFLFKKKIENMGEARERSLSEAVRDCLADERRRFDAGSSSEGEEYRRRLEQLSAGEKERAAALARERIGLERCLEQSAPLFDLASEVTFANFLMRKPVPGLTDEVMARELPSVEVPAAPYSLPPPPPSPATTPVEAKTLPGVARLQAYCRFALLVAKADGRVAQAERGKIRAYLGDQFGSDPVLLRHLDPQLEAAEKNLPEEADAIAAIQEYAPRSEWEALYKFAGEIADAMGDRTEKETQFLGRLAAAFEITADSPVVAPPPPPAPVKSSAREVLGIPEKTEITVDLVRRKYTMLIEQVCVEKAASLGPEFAKMAETKRAAIQAAAEELLAPFNAPLKAPDAPPPPSDIRHNPQLDDLFGAS